MDLLISSTLNNKNNNNNNNNNNNSNETAWFGRVQGMDDDRLPKS